MESTFIILFSIASLVTNVDTFGQYASPYLRRTAYQRAQQDDAVVGPWLGLTRNVESPNTTKETVIA